MSEHCIAIEGLQCPTCGRRFSRRDHLKRHQFRHTGQRPYNCTFCDEAFTRSDNLRDHYPTCGERNGRPIPEAARGGRRSHACDSCIAMKLGCDGSNPCKTCLQKNAKCTFSRRKDRSATREDFDNGHSPSERQKGFGLTTALEQDRKKYQEPSSSDRGSVQFLLNRGTSSFIGDPHLTLMNSSESRHSHLQTQISPDQATFVAPPGVYQDRNVDLTLFQDEEFLQFLTAPCSDSNAFIEYATVYSATGESTSAHTSTSSPSLAELEPPTLQSTALIEALSNIAIRLDLTMDEQSLILQDLRVFFTPSNIANNVQLYIEHWHSNLGVLHMQSFDMGRAPLILLTSFVFMGAIYGNDDFKVKTAKRLLDLGEAFVFSVDDLADEGDIRHMLRTSTSPRPDQVKPSPFAFENLLAAHTMVCTQFWAGTLIARKRVSQTRFSAIVKLTRRMGLLNLRHELEDCIDEERWIRKEQNIHLVAIVIALDCDMCFFANIPRRITIPEMRCELPAEDRFLKAAHPFSEPNFVPTKHVTMLETFRRFFSCKDFPPDPISDSLLNSLDLMHLQCMIHLLYCLAQNHLANDSSVLFNNSPGKTHCVPSESDFFADSTITQIKGALSVWRSVWDARRAEASEEQWAAYGFYRTAYHFWLVTQLLLSTPASVTIMMQLEIGCEDPLSQFRALLPENAHMS